MCIKIERAYITNKFNDYMLSVTLYINCKVYLSR